MTSLSQVSSRQDVEERRLVRQVALDAERTAKQRNEWGQFATPPALAADITQYVVGLHPAGEISFLEPSCGSGSFYSALLSTTDEARVTNAVGVELDARFAALAAELWGGHGLRVVQGDYLDPATVVEGQASLLVANPPYVRHHHLSAEQKVALASRVHRELGITVSGLAGLYVYFLMLSHRALAPGAISAWLIPSEFLDVNYGRAVKDYLVRHVKLIRIHRFDPSDAQFDDAIVTSSVVVFENRTPDAESTVEFTQGGSVAAPRESHSVPVADLSPASKWSPRFAGGSGGRDMDVPRFDEFFRIRRGIATGNNAFFVLPRERVEQLGIRRENIQPMMPGPRYVKQDVIDSDDDGYPVHDRQLALLNTSASLESLDQTDPALAAYLRTVDEKTMGSFLVRNRKPWYKQEQREAAPFLITYMGRGKAMEERPFRFVLNKSQAIATNMYLMLYPIGLLADALAAGEVSLEEVHDALGLLTGDQLRDGGRVYGGGLHKMEPKELAALDATSIAALLPKYRRPESASSLF